MHLLSSTRVLSSSRWVASLHTLDARSQEVGRDARYRRRVNDILAMGSTDHVFVGLLGLALLHGLFS